MLANSIENDVSDIWAFADPVVLGALTTQLRELEADGLIVRVIHAQVPPRVEYSLSEKGRTLEPVIMALEAWGETQARSGQLQDVQAA